MPPPHRPRPSPTDRHPPGVGEVGPGPVLVVVGVVGAVVAGWLGWVLAPAGVGTAVPRLALPVGRLLLDGLGVGAVGLAVLGLLVRGGQRRDADAMLATARRAGTVLAGAWAATAVVLLWLQAAEVAAASPGQVGWGAVLDYLDGFGAGAALLVTTVCAVGYGVLTNTARTGTTRASGTGGTGTDSGGGTAGVGARPGLLVVVALLGLLPGPLTGHAASADAPGVAVVAVAVHAAAAAVWVGGLGALLLVVGTRRTLLATALPRFSPVAATALAAVAVSGAVTALVHLGSLSALVDTGYGRVVLAKTAALLTLAALGTLMRRRVLPAVRTHRKAPLLAVAGTELLLMAIALGLAAALTRSPLT